MNLNNVNMMDPKNLHPKLKTTYINQNIYHSGYGDYKMCPISRSVKFGYRKQYNPGKIDSICKVFVYNQHSLDIIGLYCPHGINTFDNNAQIPAMMYPVTKDFVGTNFQSREGIYDEHVILKTNYPYVIQKQNAEMFPIKNNTDIIYSSPITVIRDNRYNGLPLDQIFRLAIITFMPINNIKLIDNNTNKNTESKILSSKDFLTFQMQIETIFQAAIFGSNNILVLTILGQEFNIPVDDQIIIYNHCIIKFGHKFKAIFICIPDYCGKGLADYIDNKIIKPINLTKEIDLKYDKNAMISQTMNNDIKNENKLSDSDKIKLIKKKIKEKIKTK